MRKLTFAELKRGIETAPMTWAPGLFVLAVKAALKHKVFQPGAMAKYCREEEQRRNTHN